MQRFSQLLFDIDLDNATSHKVRVLASYFVEAPPEDAVWAVYLLTGRRLKRLVSRATLASLVQENAQIPDWLFQECYNSVGDLAETCALLWSQKRDQGDAFNNTHVSLATWMSERCANLAQLPADEGMALLSEWWQGLTRHELFIAIKMLTGGFRSGVAQALVVKALAAAFNQSPAAITEGLSGDWPVTAEWFRHLVTDAEGVRDQLAPLPFYLASPLPGEVADLGPIEEYFLEWKWDGIRAQVIKCGQMVALWSRGEELITERFPELVQEAKLVSDDFVLDGEILAVDGEKVRPFSALQPRIGKKKITARVLAETPVKFVAFDCLRVGERDLRQDPLDVRRSFLDQLLINSKVFQLSPLMRCETWDEAKALRQKAKSFGVEGLMIKHRKAPYLQGRKRGYLWKWKVDPMTLDAVLIYAQAGHGRRGGLYTDYTFALWKDGQLVPFAKAYSGLDDAAVRELDHWIKKHTLERFGPVRSVEPLRVFEIAFEGISRSSRHKSGIAVRFPRILRERTDKKAQDADTVAAALGLATF